MTQKVLLWLTVGSSIVLLIEGLTDKDGSGGVFFNQNTGILKNFSGLDNTGLFASAGPSMNIAVIGAAVGSGMLMFRK